MKERVEEVLKEAHKAKNLTELYLNQVINVT